MTTATTASTTGIRNAKQAASIAEREKRFDWPLCYDAENIVLEQIERFLARNNFAAELSQRMRRETGTLFIDWVDYLVLSDAAEPVLRKAGFVEDPLGEVPVSRQRTFWHPEAMLPRVILDKAIQD